MAVQNQATSVPPSLAFMVAGQTQIANAGPAEKMAEICEKLKKHPPFLAILQQRGFRGEIHTLDCILNPTEQKIKFEAYDSNGRVAAIPMEEIPDAEVQKAAVYLFHGLFQGSLQGTEKFEPNFDHPTSPQASSPMDSGQVERAAQLGKEHLEQGALTSPRDGGLEAASEQRTMTQVYEHLQKTSERQDKIMEQLLEQNKTLQERLFAATRPPASLSTREVSEQQEKAHPHQRRKLRKRTLRIDSPQTGSFSDGELRRKKRGELPLDPLTVRVQERAAQLQERELSSGDESDEFESCIGTDTEEEQ